MTSANKVAFYEKNIDEQYLLITLNWCESSKRSCSFYAISIKSGKISRIHNIPMNILLVDSILVKIKHFPLLQYVHYKFDNW